MARGQTLESILNKVRAKARLSLNAANNTQVIDSHKVLIKTEQDRLWEDYAWPHMRVHKYVALQAGQYLYDLPADTYDSAAGTTRCRWTASSTSRCSTAASGVRS
jgi:hypothetical protein